MLRRLRFPPLTKATAAGSLDGGWLGGSAADMIVMREKSPFIPAAEEPGMLGEMATTWKPSCLRDDIERHTGDGGGQGLWPVAWKPRRGGGAALIARWEGWEMAARTSRYGRVRQRGRERGEEGTDGQSGERGQRAEAIWLC